MALPDFFLIGAMKCGTSTLAAQLGAQPGVFMCSPKEPCFFSDDDVFARGQAWYEGLFATAPEGALKGEASTHYTKLPTYPETIDRLVALCPAPKLVYALRDPVERLISHFLHGWSCGEMEPPLETAVAAHPELMAYSRYGMQIAPWVTRFGAERILLTSQERLRVAPEAELARVAAFLRLPGRPVWQADLGRQNVSAERIRKFPLYDLLVEHPVPAALRRTLVPKRLREAVKRRLRMRGRPTLPAALEAELRTVFAADMADLERLFPGAAALIAEPEAAA